MSSPARRFRSVERPTNRVAYEGSGAAPSASALRSVAGPDRSVGVVVAGRRLGGSAGRGSPVEGRVVGQDRRLQGAQGLPGLHADLVAQGDPDSLVGPNASVCRPDRTGQHQLAPQTLSIRVDADEALQLTTEPVVETETKFGFDPFLRCGVEQFVQPRRFAADRGLAPSSPNGRPCHSFVASRSRSTATARRPP